MFSENSIDLENGGKIANRNVLLPNFSLKDTLRFETTPNLSKELKKATNGRRLCGLTKKQLLGGVLLVVIIVACGVAIPVALMKSGNEVETITTPAIDTTPTTATTVTVTPTNGLTSSTDLTPKTDLTPTTDTTSFSDTTPTKYVTPTSAPPIRRSRILCYIRASELRCL